MSLKSIRHPSSPNIIHRTPLNSAARSVSSVPIKCKSHHYHPNPISCIMGNNPRPNPNNNPWRNNGINYNRKSKRNNKTPSDSDLAKELAVEVKKVKTRMEERARALDSSKEMLFGELCEYLKLKPDEVKRRWRKMGDEERWGLVSGFVSDWGTDFHPISKRGVKDLVDEFVGGCAEGGGGSGGRGGGAGGGEGELKVDSGGDLLVGFPGLMRLLGFGSGY